MTSPTPTPAPPPTSAAAVAAWLQDAPAVADATVAADKYGATVAAVNALVPRMATTPAEARALGATMLAGRLWRRRNSPEGVAAFTADGAVYVQRSDPDVAQLLGIGAYAPPVVG